MTDHSLIMATLTAERCSEEFVASMAARGMAGVRINSAHVTPDDIRHICAVIRSAAPSVRILMDTKGPEVRTTDAPHPVDLRLAESVKVTVGTGPTLPGSIVINASGSLAEHCRPGMEIALDDGAVMLRINSLRGEAIEAVVTRPGRLESRKTVVIPECALPPLPAVSERDKANIRAGIEAGIDMIAHSFVRSAEDVEAVRKEIEGTDIQLFAKIECREALDSFDGILRAADGLLIARGDLGACVDPADIPAIQLMVARRCHEARKPSILATQILQSMIENPVPTRAEISDIALAVAEAIDWLLLCGETAVGRYPEECVSVMASAILSAEKNSMRCKML